MTLIIIIVLAGLAGLVAPILPSRRAAKLNILRAIVTERVDADRTRSQ
jgi:ABC-type antimicrobial peptide transport system permease subunit